MAGCGVLSRFDEGQTFCRPSQADCEEITGTVASLTHAAPAEPRGEAEPLTLIAPTPEAGQDTHESLRPIPAGGTITGEAWAFEALGRTVWVWLPPSYASSPNTHNFPILYLLDGESAFDARTAVAGEWGADETASRLITARAIEPIVLVAVESAGAERIEEYAPWGEHENGTGGGGEAYLQKLGTELLPFVSHRFRITRDPSETGLVGASLGGLLALYAGLEHPEWFGKVAALSPSIWWADGRILGFAHARSKAPSGLVYMDMGTHEADGIPWLRALASTLVGLGYRPGRDLFVNEARGAGHDPKAWRDRFPDVLLRLFPRKPSRRP